MQTNSHKASPLLKYLQIVFFSALILYFGKTLFIPLFFGLLIAIILYPFCKWLERHSWPRALAIAACLLIVAILLGAFLALLYWQFKEFAKDAAVVMDNLGEPLQQFQSWLDVSFGIKTDLQTNWNENLSVSIGKIIKSGAQQIIDLMFLLFITPIFTALTLYHRKVFVRFLRSMTPDKHQHQLDMITKQIIHTYARFVKGMLMVYLLVGILNSIGLLALGVKHAILFGMLCAVMTIIPYLGTIISSTLPIMMVWMQTGNIWYPLGVVAIFVFVQYLEANVIYPMVVGTQLHVSTLAMLVAMITGGIVMGVAGMVLFIPFVAFLKIASDHIEVWKPLNLLLSRK